MNYLLSNISIIKKSIVLFVELMTLKTQNLSLIRQILIIKYLNILNAIIVSQFI